MSRYLSLPNKYSVKKMRGYTFYFKYEPPENELLHIYVRHLTTEKDAITTFFGTDSIFNHKYNRYENSNDTHTIYWNWLNEADKKIIIITCFNL